MRKGMLLVLLLVASLLLSCSAHQNELMGSPNNAGELAGFWLGLWHGIISPVTWIISLFEPSVNIYEVHNNGGWYNFGFMWGIGSFGSLGSSTGRSVARARDRAAYRRNAQHSRLVR